MAEKSPEQLRRLIEQREKPGEFNNLERNSSAISDNASIGVDSIEQYTLIANTVISDSKVERSNNRESRIVLVNDKINEYEAFKKSISDPNASDIKTLQNASRKVYTRCAEGPEGSVDLPFYFDVTDDVQKAARKFSMHIHPARS